MKFDKLPTKLHIELTSNCNAKCPMCSRTTSPILMPQNLCVDALKRFCDDSIFNEINYCGNDGDPLMYKKILDILNYFSPSKQLIHTNGSLRSSSFWKSLAKIQNLTVVFGIDGSDSETHKKYRVNTSFNKIMKNATLFNNEGGNSWWQFIVFDHNKHQINDAKQLAKYLGFKVFETLYSRRKDTDTIRVVKNHEKKENELLCKSIAKDEFYIRSDGEIFPCVYQGSRGNNSGVNIYNTGFKAVNKHGYFANFNWNNFTCISNCSGTNYNIREREFLNGPNS